MSSTEVNQTDREQKLATLERLVDELMKEAPEESLVENYMKQSGLEYSTDPINRINVVLKALHFEEPAE